MITQQTRRTAGGIAENQEAAPAYYTDWLPRQESRYWLRAGNRRLCVLDRCRRCGLSVPGSDVVVRNNEGVRHYCGVWLCGSGWACPVCAAKIRFKRANEVSKAVLAALEQGMGALFVTRTIPHSAQDRLRVTLGLLRDGRRWVSSQLSVKQARKGAGYVGGIAAKEVTYGANGWHPHSHDIELFNREVPLEDYGLLWRRYYDCLNRFYESRGFAGLSSVHGVRIEAVRLGGDALSKYVAKLQEGGDIGSEMTRADLKRGRVGSLLPYDLLTDALTTGDMASGDLWNEYCLQTKGMNVIRFTKGLRARLLPDVTEKTDEELAQEEVGGCDEVRFANWFYRKIARAGLEGKVLSALNIGGFAALVELLTVYRLDEPGGYWRLTDEINNNGVGS